MLNKNIFNKTEIGYIYFALNELVKKLNEFPYDTMSDEQKHCIVSLRDKVFKANYSEIFRIFKEEIYND